MSVLNFVATGCIRVPQTYYGLFAVNGQSAGHSVHFVEIYIESCNGFFSVSEPDLRY